MIELPVYKWENKQDFLSLIHKPENISIVTSILEYANLTDLQIDQVEHYMFSNKLSWSLTYIGKKAITENVNYCSVSINNVIVTPRVLSKIGKILKGPWYIDKNNLYFLNRESSLELRVCNNDLIRFINFNS